MGDADGLKMNAAWPAATPTVPTDGGALEPMPVTLGPIPVDATQSISIPYGLFGFDGRTQFVLAEVRNHEFPFHLLQSTEDRELGFLVMTVADDRLIRTRDLERAGRRAGIAADALIPLAIVTLCSDGARMRCTVNLRAPILIDRMRRIGMQYVLADDRYDLRHVFHLEQCSGSAARAVRGADGRTAALPNAWRL